MILEVASFTHLGDYRLRIAFEDGTSGEVDLKEHLTFAGVFAPLNDPDYFRRVRLNSELGTLCWENGADLDPVVLLSWVTGHPIPDFDFEDTASKAG